MAPTAPSMELDEEQSSHQRFSPQRLDASYGQSAVVAIFSMFFQWRWRAYTHN
jgi:hypothetical protein